VSTATADDRELQRLRWQCRRGMLELDLLLDAFLERGWGDLDEAGRRAFERLLGFPDQVILDWLMQQAVPADAVLRDLVARILAVVIPPPPRP
jgi:antitoxin CptB